MPQFSHSKSVEQCERDTIDSPLEQPGPPLIPDKVRATADQTVTNRQLSLTALTHENVIGLRVVARKEEVLRRVAISCCRRCWSQPV